MKFFFILNNNIFVIRKIQIMMCHCIRNNKRCDIEITKKEFYCANHIQQRNEKKIFYQNCPNFAL